MTILMIVSLPFNQGETIGSKFWAFKNEITKYIDPFQAASINYLSLTYQKNKKNKKIKIDQARLSGIVSFIYSCFEKIKNKSI